MATNDAGKAKLDASTKAARKVQTNYDSTLCPACQSPSRMSSPKGAKYRKCQKGHKFIKKTDDR